MSEDEGTNPDRRDDASAVESDSEASDTDVENRATDTDPEMTSHAQDEGESEAPSEQPSPTLETAADVQDVLESVREHDEKLANQVAQIAETARERNQTVADQRDELSDLEDRIDEQAETISQLHQQLEKTETALESHEETLSEREERVEELKSHLKRKQADFQNYKKRAKKRQEQLKSRATEDLVSRIVGVRDNLKRALGEEGDSEDLRDGIEMTLREFDRVLAEENVEEIDPEPGTTVDPQRHEVMVKVDSEHPEGTVADVFTPGYEMAEKVIQSAQVTVSNGSLAEADAEKADGGEATADDADAEESTVDGEPVSPDDRSN